MGKKQTIHPPKKTAADARKYIDNILAISKRHGMSGAVSKETYDAAVDKAAKEFDGLREIARRST